MLAGDDKDHQKKDKKQKKAEEATKKEKPRKEKKERPTTAAPDTNETQAIAEKKEPQDKANDARPSEEIWWSDELHRACRKVSTGIVVSGECYAIFCNPCVFLGNPDLLIFDVVCYMDFFSSD